MTFFLYKELEDENLTLAMVHCALCKRNFANGASLRTHRSNFHRLNKTPHSLQINYKSKKSCAICKRDFASGNSLRTHRSRYHGLPVTETGQTNVERPNLTNDELKKYTRSGKHSGTISEDTDVEGQKSKDRNNYKELLDIHERLIRNMQSELATFFSLID